MLSDEIIQKNKETYISIVNSITREGFKKDELIGKLENSDFFIAPASTKYHGAYKGGLCDHSLNVYFNLKSLVEKKHLNEIISDDNIAIVALFHDLSKMDTYEIDVKNKKQYYPEGTKSDAMGRYDWVSYYGYKTKEVKPIVYGSHEETAEYIIRHYIDLTVEESVAILHHMGGKGWDSAQDDLTTVFNNYPLAVLLHVADLISTYIDEVV